MERPPVLALRAEHDRRADPGRLQATVDVGVLQCRARFTTGPGRPVRSLLPRVVRGVHRRGDDGHGVGGTRRAHASVLAGERDGPHHGPDAARRRAGGLALPAAAGQCQRRADPCGQPGHAREGRLARAGTRRRRQRDRAPAGADAVVVPGLPRRRPRGAARLRGLARGEQRTRRPRVGERQRPQQPRLPGPGRHNRAGDRRRRAAAADPRSRRRRARGRELTARHRLPRRRAVAPRSSGCAQPRRGVHLRAVARVHAHHRRPAHQPRCVQ